VLHKLFTCLAYLVSNIFNNPFFIFVTSVWPLNNYSNSELHLCSEGGAQAVEDTGLNITDEEKQLRAMGTKGISLTGRPFLESVFNALDCADNDYMALFGLCLLYAMGHNKG
jgi:hypothetical protein